MELILTKNDLNILIRSIVSYELSKQNGIYFPLFFEYPKRGNFTSPPFSCDSLGLVSLAIAVGNYFGVHYSGLEENLIRYPDFESWVEIVHDSLKSYSNGITFRTSGTTGEPKEIFHSFDALEQEAIFLASLFADSQKIAAFVRPHHIYGFLYTIALPKYLKTKVSFHEPLPTNAFYAIASDSLLISTPVLYKQIVQINKKFTSNIVAVSSTEPLPKELSLELKAKGVQKTVEIYGSSETLGVGYKEDEEDYFTLFDYLQKDGLKNLQDKLLWNGERLFCVDARLDANVKHRGYLINLEKLQQILNTLDGVNECELVFTKGEIVAFIQPSNKRLAMESIAQLTPPKPDSIVWIDR